MADRLSNESELVDSVIQNGMDKVDALGFNHEGRHPRTFCFAMALGAGLDKRVPSVKRTAWLQYSAINNADSEIRSYALSLAINELRKTQEDNLMTDDDTVYGIAAEYANAGLERIREMVPDFADYDEDDFVQQLIELMDAKYDDIVQKYPWAFEG